MVPPCSDRIARVPPYSRIHRNLRIRGCHPLRPAFPDRSASRQWTTGLFRFRSPLLAESLLMSVPPGTEMFQFPGFASTAYVFNCRYPSRGGLPHSDIHGSTPARGSPWLFAACHVLHRLLVPRHPPNALLALEIRQPNPPGRSPQDQTASPPCTGASHTRGSPPTAPPRHTAGTNSAHTRNRTGHHNRPIPTPLNAHARSRGSPHLPCHHGRRTCRSDTATTARPATHQNLIHPDKDQLAAAPDPHPARPPNSRRHPHPTRSGKYPRNTDSTATIAPARSRPGHPPGQDPGGGDRIRTDDPLLAKQVLSQLSYAPGRNGGPGRI